MSSRNGLSGLKALCFYFGLSSDPEGSVADPDETDIGPWEAYFPPKYFCNILHKKNLNFAQSSSERS